MFDEEIEHNWAEAASKNPRLFDGSKFRLHSATVKDGKVIMKLGLTGYKEYLGTNLLQENRFRVLVEDGQKNHNDANAYLSNALGCEALLLTTDLQAVFLRRSGAVGSCCGEYNGPSGHPEPGQVGLPKDGNGVAFADCSDIGEKVCAQLFDSVVDEIHAETNIPLNSLSAPLLMGTMADSRKKPDLLFFVTTSLDVDAVRACYNSDPEEAWESDRLAFVAESDLKQCGLPLTQVTQAAIQLYTQHVHNDVAHGKIASMQQVNSLPF